MTNVLYEDEYTLGIQIYSRITDEVDSTRNEYTERTGTTVSQDMQT